jgi:hypothetical protein
MTRPHDGQASHQQVWELLTWYVNGTATPAQREIVERHLPQCEACRAEHEVQQRLYEHLRRDEAALSDSGPALARLLRDIERAPAPGGAANDGGSGAAAPALRHGMGRRMKFAVAALAALAVLETTTLAMLGIGRADYQTLSSPQPSAAARATIRLVVAPSMSMGELQDHLRRFELEIIGGPTEAGVYTLAPALGGSGSGADTAAALAGLRASPRVLFAEPVGALK